MQNFIKILSVFVLVYNIEINAQNGLFSPDLLDNRDFKSLHSVLNDYEIFQFDADVLDAYLSSESRSNTISLQIGNGVNWEFTLEPVELITPRTKVYTLTPEGRKLIPNKINVKAYQGVFTNGKEGSIRLTLHGDFMYGMIVTDNEEIFIEPLKYYDKNATLGQFVIYSSEEVTEEHNKHECFRTNDEQGINEREISDNRFVGNCYKAKLAILADYSMYIDPAHAGLDAVIDHVVAVMNNVETHYVINGSNNFDDGINFEISEIVVSTCATCDPLSAQANPNLLLSEFSLWVDGGGFYNQFNAAHFWSNRDFIGSAVGMAYQATDLYCGSLARAVLEDWTSTASLLKTMVAHEVGHNFNGVHDGSTGFILSPVVSNTSTWSSTSKTTIGNQITSQGSSCLDACGPTVCNRVQDIVISNITETSFTLSWTASTESLYTIKVKELGATDFIQEITTINPSITLSPPGYGNCKSYDVFVYNNCGTSGYSAVQRLLLKGPTIQGCADFKPSTSVGWPGSSIQFTDKSINATSWFWDFGNGVTSTVQNPTVAFNNDKLFDISLTVNGIHNMLITNAISILPIMSPPFTLDQGGDFETNTDYFASEVYEGSVNVW